MSDSHSSKLRVGVLPPGSNFVPFLAGDLLTALEFGLAEARLEAEVVVEFAGYNGDLKVVLPKVQHLLFAERVACVVAPLNLSLVERLAGQFESQGVPLIALSLSEDPLFESAQNPYVFVNSFHLWQAAWMCGYLGAQRFGPRAASLVALHEGGYSLNFAFQLGLEAGNGNLLQTAVTHTNSNSEDPSPSIAEIAGRDPDFIWAAYSGKEAASFLAAYEASGCKSSIPLLGLPPLVDEHVRKAAGDSTLGVYFVTPGPQRAEADGVTTALAQAIGRQPHPYALLAYESAHLIAAAARTISTPGSLSVGLPVALRQVEFQGPRGLARFDNGAGIEVPFCFRQVTPVNDSVQEVEAPPLLNEQCLLARKKLVKHGWVNPYLCA
jgi:ABC-type branched-subunit amino acid transport system substrate-binding protein